MDWVHGGDEPIDDRARVIWACRRTDEKGLNFAAAGNVSVRDKRSLWITPHTAILSEVQPNELIWCDLETGVAHGTPHGDVRRRPSSMIDYHRAIYLANEQIGAVVHAHSPYAITWSVGHDWIEPPTPPLRELGRVPCWAEQDDEKQLIRRVAEAATEYNGVVLTGHGVLAWGGSIVEAVTRAEAIERAAQLNILLQLLAAVTPH